MGIDLRNACGNNDVQIGFSIIIPVYNVEEYIRQCLDSIIIQTFKNFEIICVNDGSTDNSLNILEEYSHKDKRFKVISQENQGQGIARNKGIDIAVGKYLLFVDPNDWIEPNTLELIYNKAEKCSANVVQFDYKVFDNSKKTYKYKKLSKIAKKYKYNLKKYPYYNWEIFKKDFFIGIGLTIWNKAYLTKYIKYNNIRFAFNRNSEEHIFTIKSLILTPKIYYLSSVLYNYRDRVNSSINRATDGNFSVFENIKLMEDFIQKKNLSEYLYNEFLVYKMDNLAYHYRFLPVDSEEKYLEECRNLLSAKNYNLLLKRINPVTLSFWERIFSIKNNKGNGQKFKILTILGHSFNINVSENKEKVKLFENKKINDTTRIVSILGIQIYKTKYSEKGRIKHILGNFIYTKKIKSKIKELKIFKLFGVTIFKRIIEDDICSYYYLERLISKQHLADLFFKNKLKRIKYDFDDVYILHSNSGEIYLFLAYLAKAFLHKNNSQKPLFVATQKYHIDILKLYYPEAKYIYIPDLRLKSQSNIWQTQGHRFYILFSGNHFTKVEEDIKNQEIGQVHYLKSMLRTLNLTENDFYKPDICDDVDLEEKLNNMVNKINLQLNNFIIIAPEAMTCSELPKTFWIKLTQKLKQNKYDIYLNITNKTNKIPDCKTLDLSYREAYFLAKKAKAVISLRSGFSEFLLPTAVPNIAIYTKFRQRTKNAFTVEKGLEGFSMLKMPFIESTKICEINADNFQDENTLVDEVMSSLNKMLSQKEVSIV